MSFRRSCFIKTLAIAILLFLSSCEKVMLHTLKLSDTVISFDYYGGEKKVTGNHDELVLVCLYELDANMSEIGAGSSVSREEARLDWLTVRVSGNEVIISAEPNAGSIPRYALAAICSTKTITEEVINIKQE